MFWDRGSWDGFMGYGSDPMLCEHEFECGCLPERSLPRARWGKRTNNGSFLTGRTISAFDGSIGALTITNGNLYGSVFADYNITSLRVVAGADGVFGDIGVNPAFSQGVNFDARRNQVPPGIFARPGIQGPSIFAGLIFFFF